MSQVETQRTGDCERNKQTVKSTEHKRFCASQLLFVPHDSERGGGQNAEKDSQFHTARHRNAILRKADRLPSIHPRSDEQWNGQADANVKDVRTKRVGNGSVVVSAFGGCDGEKGIWYGRSRGSEDDRNEEDGNLQLLGGRMGYVHQPVARERSDGRRTGNHHPRRGQIHVHR